MCRNIRTLYNFDPPATNDEIHGAALQYVRISLLNCLVPSKPMRHPGTGKRKPLKPKPGQQSDFPINHRIMQMSTFGYCFGNPTN